MKKSFEEAEVKIVLFQVGDVITSSTGDGGVVLDPVVDEGGD